MTFNEDQKRTLTIVIGFAVLILGGLGYYWFFFGKKTVESKGEQLTETYLAIRQIDALLAEIDQLQSMQGEFALIEAKLDQMSSRLPTSPEAPGFLKALSDILRSTGIRTDALKPEAPVVSSRYTEIPYAINANGRFHEIGQFLNLIEENPKRFMRLKTLKISNDDLRPSVHPLEMAIATFMFVEQ